MLAVLIYVTVAVVAALVAALYVLCSLTLFRPEWSRAGIHLAVSFTIVPASLVLTLLLAYTSSSVGTFVTSFVQSYGDNLPQLMSSMLQNIKPVNEKSLTVLTVQTMMCLLLTAYGSSVIWRNLIDIIRLLKVSRRRILMPGILAANTNNNNNNTIKQ